jgi:hypothetical protein
MSIIGNSAWLFWDDPGAGPDDNHDDMIIRAVFTPATSVPEPGALALFGLGLLESGSRAGRRRNARRSTARAFQARMTEKPAFRRVAFFSVA